MDEKLFTPYAIRQREDGLVDILFPKERCRADCPCHDRITTTPGPDLEEDIRRNYDVWRERAKEATNDRCRCVTALDKQFAHGKAYEDQGDPL